MRIRIASDLHLEFLRKDERHHLPEVDANVLILAGDIHVGTKADSFILYHLQFHDVIYILGNHEGYNQDLMKLRYALNGKTTERINQQAHDKGYFGRVHFLDDSGVEIKGVRFLGTTLWTDFNQANSVSMYEAQMRVNDYHKIKMSSGSSHGFEEDILSPEDTLLFHQKSMAFLKRELNKNYEGKTVVISHHLPSYQSVEEQYLGDIVTPAFASHLDAFIEKSKAALWVHGHAHSSSDYKIGGTRVVCNPRGYPPNLLNPAFEASKTIDL